MDVQMPLRDGHQATRRIREQENDGRRIPIIGLTAHAMREDKEACLASGMDAYLSKPLNTEKLFQLIDDFAVCPAVEDQ